MIEQIKSNIHILVIINILLTFMTFTSKEPSREIKLIVIDGKKSDLNDKQLRKSICYEAFRELSQGKISDYYINPQITKVIKTRSSNDFNFRNTQKIYVKIEGRDICKVVIKSTQGFSGYEAVISKDGPLLYRVTNLKKKKPTYQEIKDYL